MTTRSAHARSGWCGPPRTSRRHAACRRWWRARRERRPATPTAAAGGCPRGFGPDRQPTTQPGPRRRTPREGGSDATRFVAVTVLDWLLDSDPGIRWQVLRDLAGAPGEVVAAERARVATEGWGARLLAARGTDGQWAGGACFPAAGWDQDGEGQPWTSTLPTLELLRDLGLDPAAPRAVET